MTDLGTVNDPRRLLHRLPWELGDPRGPALRFLGGPAYSREQLGAAVRARAAQFAAAGVGTGIRVVLLQGNSDAFVLDLLATSALGAVCAPLNVALRGAALRHTLEQLSPCVLRVGADFAAGIDIPPGVAIWPVDGDAPRLSETADARESHPSDVALILFTSGTTGRPKGVMWSHQMAIAFAEQTRWVMGTDGSDVLFTCLPLFHINALLCTLYTGLLSGAEVVVAPRFSASAFWGQIAECGATSVNLMGSMPAVLWRREPDTAERAHRLRIAMALPLPADRGAFEKRFGVLTTEVYGSTDTGLPLGIPYGERRPGSCGIPTPGWETELVDEHDVPVPVGVPGELVTRPVIAFVGQSGYWRRPDVTLEAMRNQWFHTGDLLTRDADGWYTYLGRRKDMVRVSGENVSSAEVEAALLRHPDVAEVAVFGVPSEWGEESVAAAVVLRAGGSVDPGALVSWVGADLPYFAVPRFVRFVESLPKTPTEKVVKADLQAAGIDGYWDSGPRRRGGA